MSAQTSKPNYKAMTPSQQAQAINRLVNQAWERSQTPRIVTRWEDVKQAQALCPEGVNAEPDTGLGSHVRGHQFRAGVIRGYEWSTGFPVVCFADEPGVDHAIHPGQLMSEVKYLRIVAECA